MKPIPVLLVTYNRLEYTKKALASIVDAPGNLSHVTIWDNASTESGMQDWLKWIAEEYTGNFFRLGNMQASLMEVIFSPRNVGLAPAMNYFFKKYKDEPYVVKVDNDTVLPDNWLVDLMDVMDASQVNRSMSINGVQQSPGIRLGAVSGTCVRPPGTTAADWYGAMPRFPFRDGVLFVNPACLGTGVLINMDMIRERGLLFEKFPRSPEAGPDDPCLISGWGAYIQEASAYSEWKFAMYSKVPVQLLNLKEDQVLSNDYPEYDAEVAKVREEGNRWWESVGGIEGVRKYVKDHGGLTPLPGYEYGRLADAYRYGSVTQGRSIYWHGQEPFVRFDAGKALPWLADEFGSRRYLPVTPRVHVSEIGKWPSDLLTEADNLEYRSTEEFWTKRVAEVGARASTYLTTPQVRINEFTEQHMKILKRYVSGKDVLDIGCGWGRNSMPISQMAGTYVGMDFVPALIEKAKESLPDLIFVVGDSRDTHFEDGVFDVVVAISCLSSFAGDFVNVLKELKRVLRPDGYILFLEEDFARIDWKLENV